MRSTIRLGSLLLLSFLAALGLRAEDGPPARTTAALPEICYLFAYFTGNGETGLNLAWSADGYSWQAVPGAPFLKPVLEDRILRDPCIQQGPDGTFHMVWTTSWNKGGIGYASSKDLKRWSEQKYIPVMQHEPEVQNTWAPELTYDAAKGLWLIYWSSTVKGRFADTNPAQPEGSKILNHRLYSTTTRDFAAFSPTKLFYDDGYSVIDATIVPVRDRFAIVLKDERRWPEPRKNLRLAWASEACGPYGASEPSFTSSVIPAWLEGPTVIKIGAKWFLYADAYIDKHYVLLTTTDFAVWKDETAALAYPKGIRHGTAFAVKRAVLKGLLNDK